MAYVGRIRLSSSLDSSTTPILTPLTPPPKIQLGLPVTSGWARDYPNAAPTGTAPSYETQAAAQPQQPPPPPPPPSTHTQAHTQAHTHTHTPTTAVHVARRVASILHHIPMRPPGVLFRNTTIIIGFAKCIAVYSTAPVIYTTAPIHINPRILMCIHMHTRIYTCTYTYIYTYKHMHTHIRVHLHLHLRLHLN